MEIADLSRRDLLKLAISTALLSFLPGCTTNPEKIKPSQVVVDTQGVKDLDGLILSIKKAGDHLIPSSLAIQDWYKAITNTFVENARKAADLGMQVPEWVLEKLPKKVAATRDQVRPELVAIAIAGAIFLVPFALFFTIVFASVLTLTRYITEKLNERSI